MPGRYFCSIKGRLPQKNNGAGMETSSFRASPQPPLPKGEGLSNVSGHVIVRLTNNNQESIDYYSSIKTRIAQRCPSVGRTNTRSDWVVLDFLFLLHQGKRKGKNDKSFGAKMRLCLTVTLF